MSTKGKTFWIPAGDPWQHVSVSDARSKIRTVQRSNDLAWLRCVIRYARTGALMRHLAQGRLDELERRTTF